MDVDGAAEPDTGRCDIGDGVEIPHKVRVIAESVSGYRVSLSARYDDAVGRYLVASIAVETEDGHEVTGEALRKIPVAKIAREGLGAALRRTLFPVVLVASSDEDSGSAADDLQSSVSIRSDGGSERDVTWLVRESKLRTIARVYRIALLIGDAPTQAVAQYLDVPRSTAGRWVMRARDRGVLTVQDKRTRKS
jgi:hypothetical protein